MMNTKRRNAFAGRKAQRYAEVGRLHEQTVRRILVASGKFDAVMLHDPHSPADASGEDFAVRIGVESRSFGITTSARSWHLSVVKHPHTPQFLFPLNVKPETVVRRIMELFG